MTQPSRPPQSGAPAETDTPYEEGITPKPGAALRDLRLAGGQDPAAFAAALGESEDRLRALEGGEEALPPALLPRLAEVLDAPLETVVAELYGAARHTAELEILARAYVAIPRADHREAVVTLALTLSGDGPT